MPSHAVRDAFYGGIGGIPYCRTRHQNDSWKASERGLEGIPMNEPPILLCRDCKKKKKNNSMEKTFAKSGQHLTESSEKPLYKGDLRC